MKNNQGFTLFIALTITATLLLVSTGIVTVALRQAFLTSSSRESQYAFYAADTGIECAIYWDVKNPTGYSAFATTTGPTTINCNYDAVNNPSNSMSVGTSNVSTFTIRFNPRPYSADVIVTKNNDGTTNIVSNGFNTFDSSNPRRTQRSVKVNY